MRGNSVAIAVLAAACASALLVVEPSARAHEPHGDAIIGNGTIQLGVHPHGHLNAPDGEGTVGLRFLGADGISPGCLCEGWGVADAETGLTGYANQNDVTPVFNLSVQSFTSTATTATSVVTDNPIEGPTSVRVTHEFKPAPETSNLYEVTVSIENLSGGAISDLRYRRVMDWDVPPTPFNEFVTIDGAAPPELLFSNTNGFATANPLGSRTASTPGGAGPDFVPQESLPNAPALTDSGPADHGALFDFGFGSLPAGETQTFTFYYGGAATETAALAAIDAVGADLYSFGQPNTEGGPGAGTPNTFIFAYGTVDATIALAADDESVIAGAQSVPTGEIDLADLHRTGGGNRESTPLDAIPLDAIPLDAIPLDAIPLDAIGFTSDMLQEALGGVHLSDIPLSTPAGGWAEVLDDSPLEGVPLNTITLADVYAHNEASGPNAIPLDAIPLDAIDLSQTPLDAIGLGAIALGATPLDAIPLDAIGMNSASENAADWCAALNPPSPGAPDPVPGYSCPPIDPSTETLIGLAVQGVPLDAIPLDAIPLDAIPLDAIPLDAIPLDAIPLDAIPLDAIPLDAIPLDAIPLDAIDYTEPAPVSGLRAIPLDAIPLDAIGDFVDCSKPAEFDCDGKTLGQADAAGKINVNATLFDLIGALIPGAHDASVADLIYGLPSPPELTLGDLFALVLGGEGPYEWSDLDLNEFPIALHSPDGGVITYRLTFSVVSTAAETTATLRATLPQGGVYQPESTSITNLSNEVAVAIGEPTVEATALEWEAEVEPGDQYELTWKVHAPLKLGEYPVTANIVVPGMRAARLSAPVSVEVTQTLEPNNDPDDPELPLPALEDDTLYLSHMLRGDIDRYVVPIPPAFGSTVEITLSHIAEGTDLDLTVAGPPSPTLRAAPLDAIPLQNAQLPDTEVDLEQRTQALPTEALQDVPTDAITAPPNVVRATSDNRGNADEEVRLVSQGESGNYIVQISDYQGDSDLPYMLEVEVSGPPNLGACAPRSFAHAGEGVAGKMPKTLPSDLNTLILVNQKRLGDTYGAAAASSVMAKLTELADRKDLGIVGAVIPVESDPGVAAAYAAWDAVNNTCSPQKANDVVREIGQLIDSIEPANLRYKVIVGGDDQIPFGRVPDETLIANESTYTQTLAGPNNQYKGAFGNGFLLTDDVWAEESPPQLFGHQLFVPDQAIGRLLETPGDITGMIAAFLAPDVSGAITPDRSLTTGYDFLTDGADAVKTSFEAAFGANAQTLISEDWVAKDPATGDVANDLEDALFPGTDPPQVSSLNAHFDHTRLLPAAENQAKRAANLYVSQDILDRGAGAVDQRVLFSMGCHSGLAISDQIYGAGDPLAKDWSQAFLSGGAFAWIGNNGYGLGDTVEVAYSERLHALLSRNIDELPLGEALAQAKQEYLSTLGVVSPYDAKVVMETTLFGLPMLRVGTGTPPATPPPLPTLTDPATGLQAASFNVSPSFTLVPPANEPAPEGRFYRAQTTQTTNRRPIEPALNFDVTQPGKVAHGIVITSLHSLPDEANFDAAFSRVVTDQTEDEPELVGEAAYPAKIQSLSTFSSFASPGVTRQNAVLIAGLYRSDGIPDALGVGIHRLYDQIGGYVLYADPAETDFTPPELGPLETQNIASGVGFAVNVTDADGTVEDVKVIYRDCAGTWRLSTLQPSGVNRWSGGGAVAPSGCAEIDYYLQAVDDAGNVAVSSKKVQLEPLTLPDPTGQTQIAFSLAGPLHGSGWYTGGVGVTITPTPSSALEYSLDGGAFQAYTTFTVSADGVHKVEARAADGSTNTVGFAIDTTAPTVVMTTPPVGAAYGLGQVVKADFTCADAGSGPATCSGTPANGAALDTGSLGTKTITVTATDVVGHTFTLTRTYQVVFAFQGFFSPVMNPPALNARNAGSVIPMKFSLGGNQGLNIFASGFPKSQQINCRTKALMGSAVSTTAQPPGLKFIASSNSYEYLWATDAKWKGTCRAFFLGLKDRPPPGPRADFRFN
jgi:hypothetical protein